MSLETSRLDADELLHLAINASQQDNNEGAINYLKLALEQKQDDGNIYYMLGALHAEIGMFDRAIDEMKQAVALAPDLSTAHFQLGLLYLTSGNIAEAEKHWQPLDALGDDNPLYLFKHGMLQLARNEFQECIDNLKKGIALNTSNLPLNNDMQVMIDKAEEALGTNTQSEANSGTSIDSHVHLNAYRDDDFDNTH